MNLAPTAIPWYSPEAYPEILQMISSTAARQGMTYEDWLDAMVQLEDDLRLVGRLPVRIDVDPEVLRSWCEEHGREVDTQAIGDFAVARMALQRSA